MPHTGATFRAIEQNISEFAKLGIRSMLYVGWRRDSRTWWYDTFAKGLGVRYVSVLEGYGPNIEDLRREIKNGTYDVIAYHGDVRDFDSLFPNGVEEKHFDMIFWDHGPEHVTLAELKDVTARLTEHAGKILLYVAPWGKWPQGSEGENHLERHQIDLVPEHLEDLGMTVKTFGGPDQERVGELIGWKITRPELKLGGEW